MTGVRHTRLAAASHGAGAHRLGVCAVEITAAGREIQLLPAGPFRGVDGRPQGIAHWQLDRERFEAWLAEAGKKVTRLAIDYEHESLPDENGRRRKWAAAGWFTAGGIEVRDSGVWATDVEWTPAAKQAIEDREVAYISPVFFYDGEGAVIGLATHVAPAALTNTPAIDGMQPALQAAANQLATEDNAMEELLELLGLEPGASEKDITAAVTAMKARNDALMAAAADQLDEATLNQAKAAWKGLLEPELAAASQGEPDPSQYVPVGVVNELRDELAALSAKQTESEVAALVQQGLEEGRLMPAQKGWATQLGKKDIAALKQYLDSTNPIPGLRRAQTNGEEPPGDTDDNGLTPNQLAVASQMGIEPAEYAKTLKEG